MFRPHRSRLATAFQDLPLPLLAAMIVNAFGAGLFYPFALLYYTRVTSLAVSTIGLTLTTATLLTLVVSPVTGSLVDRYGARRLVVTSQVLEAVGFALLLRVSTSASLFVAALLVTGATRMFYASFSTLVAEPRGDASRDRVYGLVGLTQSLAASTSGLLAGVLISSSGLAGFRVVIIANAMCLVLSAVSLSRLGQPQSPAQEIDPVAITGFRAVLGDRGFMRMVAANVLFVMCSMLPGLGAAVYLIDALGLDPVIVGALGVAQTALVVGLQIRVLDVVAGRDRIGSMVVAGGMWIVACLGYAAAMHLRDSTIFLVVWLLGVTSVFSIAQMLYVPTARALAATMAPAGSMGRYVATFEFSYGLAAALGPVLFGTLFDIGAILPWLMTASLVAVAAGTLRGAGGRSAGAVPD